MTDLTRRQLLLSLPLAGSALVGPFATALKAQADRSPIAVRTLNHVGLAVSDPKRSLEFYQGLFGMPIQARQGLTTVLRVGAGPQFLSIQPALAGASRIAHYGLGVDDFSIDRLLTALAARGVAKGNILTPMQARVTSRGGSAELAFADHDGIVCQLDDAAYCGGAGPLGSQCSAVAVPKGLIALADLNHVTIFASDPQRSNKFLQDLFGFSIRSYQGPTAPTLAVGPTVQFVMFTSGGAAAAAPTRPPASIHHACLSLNGFKPDEVIKSLESYGLTPRDPKGPVGPLRHYVTMRMENRGGAPGGTPELYFTDPDGLLIQLQDTSYCGGSGVLGNSCPKL